MGTNYYLYGPAPCEKCGRPFESRHIGKSSAGWVFALHIYPDDGIKDLPDWYDLWTKSGAIIKDEYGETLSAAEMIDVILARFAARWRPKQDSNWHRNNHSEPGPYGLARARIDGVRVIGHGLGTYSLHVSSDDSW